MTFTFLFFFCYDDSPYAYQFGLGKRVDADEVSNYDDDGEFYSNTNSNSNNYDKADLNLENWNDGGYMDNKNDIDVLDYGYGYPRGQFDFVLLSSKIADNGRRRN
jgi:hypothetical protein